MTDPRPGRLPADRLHLLPRHREKLEALIRAHLHGVEVWAYGSRVNGRSHDGSDLDLVLRGLGLQDIPPGQLADFTEALRDSTIPFLVEARDWARLPEHFHCEIERGYVVLVEGEEQRVGDECQEAEEVNRGMAGNVHSKTLRDYFTLQRGTTYKSRLLEQPGPVLLGLATIQRNGSFRSDSLRTYGGDSPKNLLVQPGELYASLKDVTQSADLLGAVARLPVGHAPGRLTQDTVKLEPKFEGVPIDYIYWLLRTPQSRAYCRAHATGTTNLGLPRDDFLALPVPELTATRSSIVNALMALDDKIELNRRMNETLEEMARALFKSWFVDFDPVHAKATLKHHAANQAPRQGVSTPATEAARSEITPPLRGSRQAKGASPQARRRGEIRRLYSPQTLQKAQALRHNQTDAEGLLWHYLCNKQLGGYKFRRQQPISPYIVDFACLSQKLLIELDGSQHAARQDYDEKRDAFLRERGYRVLRFWNNEVFENCFGVLERIYAVLPHHPPLEGGSKDASLSGRGDPPPQQPSPDGLAAATPPQGGSDWTIERARAYLDSMDKEIADLFPDRLVDSELGLIPEGWEVKALDEIADFQNGLALQKFRPTENEKRLPVVKIAQLRSGQADSGEWATENITPECIVDDGDVLFSWSGSLMVKVWCGGRAALNQHLFKVTSSKYPKWFYLHCIESHLPKFQSIAADKTTTMGHIKRHHLSEAKCAVPDLTRFGVANDTLSDLFAKRISNVLESNTLAALRDVLLPKLISGNLRLKNAEFTFEGVE